MQRYNIYFPYLHMSDGALSQHYWFTECLWTSSEHDFSWNFLCSSSPKLLATVEALHCTYISICLTYIPLAERTLYATFYHNSTCRNVDSVLCPLTFMQRDLYTLAPILVWSYYHWWFVTAPISCFCLNIIIHKPDNQQNCPRYLMAQNEGSFEDLGLKGVLHATHKT